MVKPGFKQTEVGELPEDWDVSTIGDEFTIQLGKMLDAEKNVGASKPYLGNKAVQWGRIDISEITNIKLTTADIRKFRLRENDLLVCEGGDVGRAAIWQDQLPECYYQKALHRLRPKREFNVQLTQYMFEYWASIGFFSNYVTQTSIAHLPKDKLQTMPFPLPSTKEEQNLIEQALSDTDKLIVSLENLIAKKRDIKTATMQQLLTGKKRLPGFGEGKGYKQTELGEIPEDWDLVELGNIAKIEMGQSPSSSNYNEKGVGLPLVQGNADIRHRRTIIRNYTSQITKSAKEGDIILSVRAPVGEVAMAVFDCCIGRGVCAIKYSNDYLYHWLISFELSWEKYSKGSTFDSINSDELKELKLSMPSDINEQLAIAYILSDMNKEINVLESQQNKTKSIKQGMMQELLTGRTRLVEPQAAYVEGERLHGT